MIYHILPASVWQSQAPDQPYRGDTLATEGFIHCTGEPDWLLKVANYIYRHQPGDFVILCIAPDRVHAAIKWEKADGHEFPHIYGPLNLDAVEYMVQFPRDATGQFVLPLKLSETG
ncbi:MAG: DUF952 domain-containing protein [Caldilineaceae bacterium]